METETTKARFAALRMPVDAAERWLARLEKDARDAGLDWLEPIIKIVSDEPQAEWDPCPATAARGMVADFLVNGMIFVGTNEPRHPATFRVTTPDGALSLYRWLVTGEGP